MENHQQEAVLFLNCLYGSEFVHVSTQAVLFFLNCLYGSEQLQKFSKIKKKTTLLFLNLNWLCCLQYLKNKKFEGAGLPKSLFTIRSETVGKILQFRNDRNWSQFHNPKDLAISLSLEASELLECFQWSGSDKEVVKKRKAMV